MITVFGHQVNWGERAYFTIPAGELAHKAVIEFPVIVAAGKEFLLLHLSAILWHLNVGTRFQRWIVWIWTLFFRVTRKVC